MTVLSRSSATTRSTILVVGGVRISIIPMGTFVDGSCGSFYLLSCCRCWIDEQIFIVAFIHTSVCRRIPTITYLTVVFNLHVGIVLNVSVLTTTIDRAFDEGMSTNGYLSLCSQC